MSEYLAKAAENMGMPESLVLRSAEAKASASGVSVDAVLAEWAGAEAPAETAPEAEATTETPTVESEAPVEEAAPVPAVAAEPPEIEGARSPEDVEITFLDTPETVTPDEALAWDQVTTVASEGLTEKTITTVPSWLVAVFVLVPLVAVFWIGLNADGVECGEAGNLDVGFDGTQLNCDGTAWAPGGGGGGELTALFAEGQEAYATCAGCHGAGGEGGTGPAFAGGAVLDTWPACEDHIEWISLGSSNWPDATYGANSTPVAGGMPGYEAQGDDYVLAVSFYERVRFGGLTLEDAALDCGLEVEGEDGEDAGTETEGGDEATDPAEGDDA